jgi:hypothetical protein
MKKEILYKILLCISLILLIGCLSKKNSSEENKIINLYEPADLTTGSFIKISIDSDSVKEAFNFLKSEIMAKSLPIELGKIISAESQVVAGQKIRLFCKYKDRKIDSQDKILKAVIYIDLSGKKTLENILLDMKTK